MPGLMPWRSPRAVARPNGGGANQPTNIRLWHQITTVRIRVLRPRCTLPRTTRNGADACAVRRGPSQSSSLRFIASATAAACRRRRASYNRCWHGSSNVDGATYSRLRSRDA